MKSTKLPFNIKKSDLKCPPYKRGSKDSYINTIELYRTAKGWFVCTLPISKSKKFADRTYAVDERGEVWSLGKGPHVLETMRVIVMKSRLKALKELVDLHNKGLVKANEIRDRRSSRMARGTLRRGLYGW